MRPIRTTFVVLCSTFLLARASAQGPVGAAAVEEATQALPPAEIPEPALVPPPAQPPKGSAVEETLATIDTPDEEAIREEIQAESAELDAIRQAEEAAKVREAPGARGGSSDGLGLESPIRDRVDGALGRDGAAPAEGGRIALLPELDHDLAALQAEYDIPIEVNEAVVAYVRFFQSPLVRGHFVKWLGRSYRYMEKYRAILKAEGLPEDTVFLAMIESGFANFATSRASAVGPWQFIAQTGKAFGLKQDFWVDERRDPEKSARAASRFLKQLYQQTGDWRLAWAGYNAGVGRVFVGQRQGYDDFWEMAAVKGRGAPFREETKGYVPKLMAAAIVYKHQEAFGFTAEEIERESWTDYEEVSIPHATLLSVLARAAGVAERELMDLNPDLRRVCTPPRPYKIKIPKVRAEAFAKSWPAMQGQVRLTFAGHVIRKGDTLSKIASRYGVPVQGIVEMNGLRGVKRLRVGSELLIPKPVGSAVASARLPAEPVARRSSESARERLPVEQVAAHASAPAKQPKTNVKVRAGDTLWSISQRYGVELDELCRWNGIKNPQRHKLFVGARLVVYPERG
jgi:membrane-bound lytic murein transglycosylase D